MMGGITPIPFQFDVLGSGLTSVGSRNAARTFTVEKKSEPVQIQHR